MEDTYKMAYLVYLTMDSWLLFIIFEKDISFTKYSEADTNPGTHGPDDAVLPFKLSQYYATCR